MCCLVDIAAESGRIPKGAFVRWEMQLLSGTVQRGNAEMYRRSVRVCAPMLALQCSAGASARVIMGHVCGAALVAVLVVQ